MSDESKEGPSTNAGPGERRRESSVSSDSIVEREEGNARPAWVNKAIATLDGVKIIFDKLKEIAKDVPIIIGSLGFGGVAIGNFFGFDFGMNGDEEEAFVVEVNEGVVSIEKESSTTNEAADVGDMVQQHYKDPYPQQQTYATTKQKDWYEPHIPHNQKEFAVRIFVQVVFLIMIIWAWKKFHKKKKEKKDKSIL